MTLAAGGWRHSLFFQVNCVKRFLASLMRPCIHLNGLRQAGWLGAGSWFPERKEEGMGHKGSPSEKTGRPLSRHD